MISAKDFKHPLKPRYEHKVLFPILCFIFRRKLDQQTVATLEDLADAKTEIPA